MRVRQIHSGSGELGMLVADPARLGYRAVSSDTIDEHYPQLAPLLASACDFVIDHKCLTSQP